jgi:hypothetical protein
VQDTTLMIHFFGRKGDDVLKYDDFSRLELNLNGLLVNIPSNSKDNNLACTCTCTYDALATTWPIPSWRAVDSLDFCQLFMISKHCILCLK